MVSLIGEESLVKTSESTYLKSEVILFEINDYNAPLNGKKPR
jgi:hypothetical protein